MSFFASFAVICLINVISNVESTDRPNILFIWFDDLGFGDAGYNGADYPTPILDELARNDAIKINFHYTEQVCTASRTALLCGRYSWLTGQNSVVGLNTVASFNTSLTLFPEVLAENNYDAFIAGKWHIGYAYHRDLPFNRGFNAGFFSHQGLQYYERFFRRNWQRLDNVWGNVSDVISTKRNKYFGKDFKLKIHDTYKIEVNDEGEAYETAAYIGNTDYNEDIYTNEIKDYIKGRDGVNPFFLYYSQWTPHSSHVQPPNTRPDGTLMNYTACFNAFPNRTQDNCSLAEDTRCVFCKQVHYASQNIEEIIDEVKNNDNLDWDNTVVIITSDNGASPMSASGYSNGSALPYRGSKSGTFEGGIRTPAIIKGGFIENILGDTDVCDYNDMLHISDWYSVMMDIAGITDYPSDSDHKSLEMWEHIKCKCQGGSDNDCDNSYKKRDELIMMRICGDPQGDYDNGDKFFYSAYVRKGNWKLIINGSNSVTETCDDIANLTEHGTLVANWLYPNESSYIIPNLEYYDYVYSPRLRYDDGSIDFLYRSDCLDQLADDATNGPPDNADINDRNYEPFAWDTILLFNIGTDKIEACAVDNDTIKDELFSYLVDRSSEYTVSTEPFEEDPGSFRAQMESYDCELGVAFTKPWNGQNGAVAKVWQNFIEIGKNCSESSATTAEDAESEGSTSSTLEPEDAIFEPESIIVDHNKHDENNNNDNDPVDNDLFELIGLMSAGNWIVIIMIFVLLIYIVFILGYKCGQRRLRNSPTFKGMELIEFGADDSDETVDDAEQDNLI